jgi:NADH:ubiquinone oxidoreductase subunit 6 (subunit J)
MTPQSCLGTGWKAKPNEVSNSDTLSPAGYLHVLCDCQLLGLLEVFKLIGAYDVIVTFGVPFVMVIEGGAVTVQPKIVWNGVAANAFLLLWIAGVVAWLWHKIASRLASSKLRIIKTVSTGIYRTLTFRGA